MTALLATYRGVTRALGPFLPLWLGWRARRGKEDPARLHERQGRHHTRRPDGPLVWLHGASLGESRVIGELVSIIRDTHPETNVLVTTQTRSGAGHWAARDDVIHAYAPLDTPANARRFLRHWRPDLALFAESEIWPNLLRELRVRGVPAALVNARMNHASLARWARTPATLREVFASFETVLAADSGTSRVLSDLLGITVPCPGNLKSAASPRVDADAARALRESFGTRPVICLASLHPEEAGLVEALDGHARIVVPRHPERFPDIGAPRRSRGELPVAGTSAYLMDTFGEMGTAMAASDMVVMGGSFAPGLKGHNPLEALALRKPVVSGLHVDSFADIYADIWRITLGPAEMSTIPQAVANAAWSDELATLHAERSAVRGRVAEALRPLLDKALS